MYFLRFSIEVSLAYNIICKFHMYNIIFLLLYILMQAHHQKFSFHPSSHSWSSLRISSSHLPLPSYPLEVKVTQWCPVLCDPQGLYNPWNSPSWNTGVGSLSLPQGIFPTQGSNPGLPQCRRILHPLSHQGSPKNTGVGSLALPPGIFPTQELNQGLLHGRRVLYQLRYQGSPSGNHYSILCIPVFVFCFIWLIILGFFVSYIFYTWEVIQCLSFSIWLTSCSMIRSRSAHTVTNASFRLFTDK